MHAKFFVFILGTLLGAGLPGFGQDYVARTLPSLGGGHTDGRAMNSKGEVAGQTFAADNSLHSFLWSRTGGMVDLEPLIGQHLAVTGINSSDTVAGFVSPSNMHAAIWSSGGGFQDLGTLGGASSIAEGISDLGQVAGCADTSAGTRHAFVWLSGTGMQDLDADINDNSCALATSSNGKVVGQIIDGNGSVDTFVWSQQQGLQLTGLGPGSHPFSVNDAGAVTGGYQTPTGIHAFFWTHDGGLEDLGAGGGMSVNNLGQVLFGGVGGIFIWTHASGSHKVPQLGVGWNPVAINDAGQILVRANERTRVLTPAVKVSLTSSANPSQVGQSVTFTATATSVQGAAPDGELIVFRVSNKVLAKVPLAGGTASVATSKLSAGTHKVTAQYVGDVNYFAKKSPALTQVVNP